MRADEILVVAPAGDLVEAWVVAVIEALLARGGHVLAAHLAPARARNGRPLVCSARRLSGVARAGEEDAMRLKPLPQPGTRITSWAGVDQLPASISLVIDLSGAIAYRPRSESDPPVLRLRFGAHRSPSAAEAIAESLLRGSLLHEVEVARERASSTTVVARGTVALDPSSWSRSQNASLWKASELLPRAVSQPAESGDWAPQLVSARTSRPARLAVAGAQVRTGFQLARQSAEKLAFEPNWNVALQHLPQPLLDPVPSTETVSRLTTRWLADGYNVADPLLIDVGGATYLFVERWRDLPASIAAGRINAEGVVEELTDVLKRPYHLSYPTVFEDDGAIWLVPESSANRCITLFQAEDFPGSWREVTVLVDGLNAVDPTILREDGGDGYWLWTAIARRGRQRHDELWLFHSSSLTGPWRPHPCNPVVDDPRSARPAGALFRSEGRLIRPAQDCLTAYGRRIVLNEILELNPQRYRERPIATVEPSWADGLLATHTISRCNGWQAVDGARRALRYRPRWGSA